MRLWLKAKCWTQLKRCLRVKTREKFSPTKTFFPFLHFQLLIVFKKQFSRQFSENIFSSVDLARVVFNLHCEQFSHKIPNIYKKWKFSLFLKLFLLQWLIFFWRIQLRIRAADADQNFRDSCSLFHKTFLHFPSTLFLGRNVWIFTEIFNLR